MLAFLVPGQNLGGLGYMDCAKIGDHGELTANETLLPNGAS